ncbi:hypothetical protein HanHA300_Chr01g0012431 [Helianthus annuus]|nr:hypothetical protein HanHA300_Chr01g0012431 [Helianthus annuus]KAJ0622161.1 hypothetical protein HanIR_Chr01g0016931 [Helianthus annuus]
MYPFTHTSEFRKRLFGKEREIRRRRLWSLFRRPTGDDAVISDDDTYDGGDEEDESLKMNH